MATPEGTIEIREVQNPTIGDFEARCRMVYGAVCAGTDTHVLKRDFDGVSYPSIIGHESVGEVIELGQKVETFAIGDHITRVGAQAATAGLALSWGGMCEYGVARDHEAMKNHGLPRNQWEAYRINQVIPAGLLEDVYEPMFITWRETLSFILRVGVTSGSRVMIFGSGANGLSLAAMATAVGAEATLLGSASRKRQGQAVAATFVDYRNSEDVKAFVGRNCGTMNILIDATGNSETLNTLLPLVANGGSIAVYGMDELNGYAVRPLQAGKSFYFYNGGYDEAETHDRVIEIIRSNKLDPSIWIDRMHVYSWSNIGSAFKAAADRTQIKPVVRLTAAPSSASPALKPMGDGGPFERSTK